MEEADGAAPKLKRHAVRRGDGDDDRGDRDHGDDREGPGDDDDDDSDSSDEDRSNLPRAEDGGDDDDDDHGDDDHDDDEGEDDEDGRGREDGDDSGGHEDDDDDEEGAGLDGPRFGDRERLAAPTSLVLPGGPLAPGRSGAPPSQEGGRRPAVGLGPEGGLRRGRRPGPGEPVGPPGPGIGQGPEPGLLGVGGPLGPLPGPIGAPPAPAAPPASGGGTPSAPSNGSGGGSGGTSGLAGALEGAGRLGRAVGSSAAAAARAARPPVGESTPAVRIIRSIPTAYRVALIALALLALALAAIAVRAWRRSVRAEQAALVDALTGVANRQAFEQYLTAEWTRADRYRRALGLLLLDIDGLKQVNDDQGHAAGDQVLRTAAMSIAARVRESDTVARIGGDEFVVICPETRAAGLEKLARALEEDFDHLPVGVSVGFAQREPSDEGPPELLSRADAAMYRHKRSRRGRYVGVASSR